MVDSSRRDFLNQLTLASSAAFLCPLSFASSNTTLEYQINSLIKTHRRRGVISDDERTAWSVYDFNADMKLVSINEEQPMQAASMVKPFIALAFFYLNNQNSRRYPYGPVTRAAMQRMLVKSSNHSTNKILKLCGGPRNTQAVINKYSNGLFKQLNIVEYIPARGKTYSNKASAHDYSKFLYAMWKGKLPMATELKRLMSIPNKDRIQTGTSLPKNLKVFDKTGSTSMLCGNMGIVVIPKQGNDQVYTFIGIIEKNHPTSGYTKWIRNRGKAMRNVSELAYQYIS